jgi:hypothetical protein
MKMTLEALEVFTYGVGLGAEGEVDVQVLGRMDRDIADALVDLAAAGHDVVFEDGGASALPDAEYEAIKDARNQAREPAVTAATAALVDNLDGQRDLWRKMAAECLGGLPSLRDLALLIQHPDHVLTNSLDDQNTVALALLELAERLERPSSGLVSR